MPRAPTPRYPHGALPFAEHVAFLEEYFATRPPGPFQPTTKKSRQRGEIFLLRGALRMKYPGWQSDITSIRAAMQAKSEWASWYRQVYEEREEKLEKRQRAKRARRRSRD